MQQGSLPVTVTAFGQIQPRDNAQQSIAAPLTVRVSSVMVRAGLQIPAGTPMMTVIPTAESHASYVQAKLAARLANEVVERDKSMVQARLLTQTELAKAENDAANAQSNLQVLEEDGAAGPKTLKAASEALVMKVDANTGSVVQQGAPLIELAPPDSLILEVGVIASQASSINPGDKATITPVGGGQSLQGKVLSREAMIDASTGLVPIQISFPLGKMLAGEMARAVITASAARGYVVPHGAIMVDLDDGGSYVMQSEKMVAKQIAVDVLATNGKQDVISGDDLDPKAPVVVLGGMQLSDGMKLRLAEAGKGAGSK
jgi:membrane fusion protein, multidrug efflux system